MDRKNADMWEALLLGMAGESNDSIIRSQEKRGQSDLVNSEVLPKECIGCTLQQFELMGIKFGNDVDDLFVEVILPTGWKKVATEHNMWSILLDEKGRERVRIFYKAAFYDRHAHLNIVRRFSYGAQPVCGYGDEYDYNTSLRHGVVTDCEKIIFSTDPIDPTTFPGERYKIDEILYQPVKKWLDEHYPDWENPLAYWD